MRIQLIITTDVSTGERINDRLRLALQGLLARVDDGEDLSGTPNEHRPVSDAPEVEFGFYRLIGTDMK